MTGPEYTALRQSVKMSQMYGITGKTKHVMLDISFIFTTSSSLASSIDSSMLFRKTFESKGCEKKQCLLVFRSNFFITFVLSEDDCEQNSEGRQIAENLTDTLAQKSADCDEVQSLKVRYAVSYLICSIKRRGVYQIF